MRSRFIISILFCLCYLLTCSQKYNYSIGVTAQPFFYYAYNKKDWDNRPHSYPEPVNNFNAFALGVAFSKPFTDNLSFKSEITYSKQSQKHVLNSTGDSIQVDDYYGRRLKTSFDILKLPLMANVDLEIGYESGLYLSVYGGVQASFLTSYKEDSRYFDRDLITGEFHQDKITNQIIRTPKTNYQILRDFNHDPTLITENNFATDFFYTRWLFGVIGGAEIKKTIGENVSIGLGARADYDFTDAYKHHDLVYNLGNYPRPNTHNLRYSLVASVSYLIL